MYYRVHTYDRGSFHESIIGPPFKSIPIALRWVYTHYEKVSLMADWEIKEHTV